MSEAYSEPVTEMVIDIEDFMWTAQDHARDKLALLYDLDDLPHDPDDPDKQYWWAVIEAVASCTSKGPNGEVELLESETIEQLLEVAEQSDLDTILFLQTLAQYCNRRSRQRKKGRPELSPEEQLSRALEHFEPEKWYEPSPERSPTHQLYLKLADELRREEGLPGEGHQRDINIPGTSQATLHDRLFYVHRGLARPTDPDTQDSILRKRFPILSVELQAPQKPAFHLFRPCDLNPNSRAARLFYEALDRAGIDHDSSQPVVCAQTGADRNILTIVDDPYDTALGNLL